MHVHRSPLGIHPLISLKSNHVKIAITAIATANTLIFGKKEEKNDSNKNATTATTIAAMLSPTGVERGWNAWGEQVVDDAPMVRCVHKIAM